MTPPRLQGRAFTSVFSGFAFLLLAASGAVLFISPPGRVANWTDWTLFGLRKSEWTSLHIWFSALFLAAVVVHLLYNVRPLVGYFRDRATRKPAVRGEWLLAGTFCAGVAVGAVSNVAPFSSLIAWSEDVKESWDKPAERAPIPHAELLTLDALAGNAGVSLATATARLNARGITGFSGETIVKSLAATAQVSAQQVFEIISKDVSATQHGTGGGLGWKTLGQYCEAEQINAAEALARLDSAGIKATVDTTLREIAATGQRKPYEVVDLIRAKRE